MQYYLLSDFSNISQEELSGDIIDKVIDAENWANHFL